MTQQGTVQGNPPTRRLGGVTGRGFQPGRSGNPGGRPKGLETLVAKRTGKGADLVNFMADVFHLTGEFEHARVPLATRMEAAMWLADRLWGKPKQSTELTGKDGGPLELQLQAVDARERLLADVQERRARLEMLPRPADEDAAG